MFESSGYSNLSVLHQGVDSLIYRAFSKREGIPVIIKTLRAEHPPVSLIKRYKHEFEILRSINSDKVVRAYELVESIGGSLSLVLEDFGGESLKRKRFAIREFLEIAIKICRALHDVHTAGIIHRDINPSNIVYNLKTGQLKIIDLGIAASVAEGQMFFEDSGRSEGTFAYISPEQTGRMNRREDWRTDIYSLGVTFYQMLTGSLPFDSPDPQQLFHDHIAREPADPRELNPLLPSVLCDIVKKLLAKNADERYQSAIGITADIEECLARLTDSGEIAPFPIARKDVSERFVLPSKLYGRDAEMSALLSSLERIAGGQKEMFLISGAPGVGKTALIREMVSHITNKQGRFISSKFDQIVRNVPYSAIIGALRELVNQLLAEPEQSLEEWKQKIQDVLGSNGQVMTDLIPELELIIGPQQPVDSLKPVEAQNRLKIVFHDFIALFCRREHPIVIFFDDLQWVDFPSLGLIESIMSVEDGALLLVCAYRDNEVNDSHPFISLLKQIPEKLVQRLELKPLYANHVAEIIADFVHQDRDDTWSLAELVQKKTWGNPFFICEFLKTLNSERLLTFDASEFKWRWDLKQISAKGFTDNVVELVMGNIGKMKQQTQLLLIYASMLGNIFDLEKLSLLAQQTAAEILPELNEAIRDGLITPQKNDSFAFAHDRMQQGAYAMLTEDKRCAEHLRAGRLLLAGLPADKHLENIFCILDQFNKGGKLITSVEEKARIARLNYQAGLKAKDSAAFDPAFQLFQAGLELLDEAAWDKDYDFTLALHNEAAETAFFSAHHEDMERLGTVILAKARKTVDKVHFHITKINHLLVQGKFGDALELGLDVLEKLDFKAPSKPNKLQVILAFLRTEAALRGKSPEEMATYPDLTDPRLLAVFRVLDNIMSASYISSPDTFALLCFKAVHLLAQNRVNCASGRVFYACYGKIILVSVMGKVKRGLEVGKLTDLLGKREDAKKTESPVNFYDGFFLLHWINHLRATLEPVLRAHRFGLEYGNLEYAAYGPLVHAMHMFLAGNELSDLEKDFKDYLPVLERLKQERSYVAMRLFQQVVLNLRGLSDDPCVLAGEAYREQEYLPVHEQGKDLVTLFDVYFCKMLLCYLFERYDEALQNSISAEKYLQAQAGQAYFTFYHFYASLVLLANVEGKAAAERRRLLKKVAHNQKAMKKWAKYAPMNFTHKVLLIEAELHRLQGKNERAAVCYEGAIKLAGDQKFLNEEAIANELMGRFYLAQGKTRIAAVHIREARYLYERWGAVGKVKHLNEKYSDLKRKARSSYSTDTSTGSGSGRSSRFDINTVIKASEAISREIFLDKLLAELIKIIMENAGAQRGFLILNEEGRLTVEAQGSIDSSQGPAPKSVSLDKSTQLCAAIVNYVERTRKTLVLSDAAREGIFTNDEYIRRRQPRSVLCMPIMNQATLIGVLYLENNLASGAFTDQMVEVLTILGSQAAISIANARLYSKLQESESNYRGLYENAVEGIFQCTPEGKMLSCNPSMAKIMGFDSKEEYLARANDIFGAYFNNNEKQEILRQLLEKGQVLGFETRIYRRGGDIIWVSISARTVWKSKGIPLYFEGSLADISAQKEKESERHERESAEAASRAKGEFLAKMSHDIRTPMNAIIGMTDLALREPLSEKAREYVRIASSSAVSLLGLIDDILDFSKIEAGKLDFDAIELDIVEVMESISDMFRDRTLEKGIELVTDLDPKLPRKMIGDPLRLRQILINLVGNAIKFTDKGEIVLSVRLEREDAESLTLSFSVRDSGIGIPPEKIAGLFDVFVQADGSIARKYGGTGLGLSICKRLTEMMGGNIWVESQPVVGSTFHFTVCLRKAPGDSAPLRFEQIARGQKALVLTPCKALSGVMCRDMGLMGVEAHAVESLPEAIESVRAGGIRLVVIDSKLPGDVLPVIKELRTGSPMVEFVLLLPFRLEPAPEVNECLSGTLGKPVKRRKLSGMLTKLFASDIAAAAEKKPAEQGKAAHQGGLAGLRVLLVEDNKINQMLARILLEGAGIAVSIAEDGQQAVKSITENTGAFDLVLMDVQMPEMDGYEATREIRKDARFSALPIIAMTANAMKGDRELCLESGMNDYVSKPINRKELFSTIEKWKKSRSDD